MMVKKNSQHRYTHNHYPCVYVLQIKAGGSGTTGTALAVPLLKDKIKWRCRLIGVAIIKLDMSTLVRQAASSSLCLQ